MRSKKLCALIAVLAVICLLLAACTGVPKITGFRIDTSEMQLEYEKGEAADFSKLKVEAIYSDKTVKTLSKGGGGYTLDLGNYDKDVVGEYTVTVKYKTFEVKTFQIKVKESETPPIVTPTLTAIEIKTAPKTEYENGEDLDLTGLVVQKVMSDGTKADLTASEYTVDTAAYDKTAAGTYAIAVTLKADETKTVSFNVTVKAPIPTLTGIEIKTAPKTEYENGEDLDLSGLVVQKVKSDGTKVDLTASEYTVDSEAYNKTTAGTYAITVTLKADETKTVSFNVTVKAPIPTLTGIEIKTAPKTEYENGEDLDLSGLVVQKVMSDGTKVDLTASEYTVDSEAYNKTTAGTYAITVTLKADETKTVSFNVTVKEAVPTVTYSIQSMPRTAFLQWEEFNAFGLKIARTDASGKTVLDSSDFDVDFSAYNGSVAGRYEIVIRVKEPTANAPKNAKSAVSANVLKYTVSVSAVELNLAHVKINYREGDPLDTTNLTVALVDADGQETLLTKDTDYFVDETSYSPWFDNHNGERKIKIVVKDYPDFPIYYDYYMNYAAVASAEIDWSRTSSVLPYGYAPDEKDSDAAGVTWKGIDINGKSVSGWFEYIQSFPDEDLQWERPLDTITAGVYHATLKARTSSEDEPIVLSLDVTVLAQDAPYVTGLSAWEGRGVTLPYGEPINLEKFKVSLQMSDGTSQETTLNETDFIIEYSDGGTTLTYELKYGFKPNYSKLADSFYIYYTATEPLVGGIRAESQRGEGYYLTKTGGNDYTGYLKLPGVEYTLSPLVYGGYGHLTILSINGVPFEDPDYKNPNGFIWNGGDTVIDYQIEIEGLEVPIKGTVNLSPDPDFINPDSVLEFEIDGVTQSPYYYLNNADYVTRAELNYIIPKVKMELPIRFRLLKDGYRLSFRNDTEAYASSDTETTYYYLNADKNQGMFVHYTLVSSESGNAIVDGIIRFQMETMITSFTYDGNEVIDDNGGYRIHITTAPQLQKIKVSLVSGYTYRIFDSIGNEILSDAQLLQVLNSSYGILSLKVYDADGVLYETHSLGFEMEDKTSYERYYYEQIASPEYEIYEGYLELFADGEMFQIYSYEYWQLEQLQNKNWSLRDRNVGHTISSAVFAFYDKEGNAVDLATVNVLCDTFYFRATYTVYGMYREWDPEKGEEKVIFKEVTRSMQWAFRFTSIADLPNVYLEAFEIAPVPINMGENVDRFETFVWAFRTDVVTKDSFGVRFRPEYRDTMTMTVEDAGHDRFLAKFFLEGRLVTFLYVDVARTGLVNADTYADFTYENLTDGKTSFVKFKNNEAYLTMSVGSYINVLAANEWAQTSVAEEIDGINTDYLSARFGAKQIVLAKEGIYTVTVTVTSTDKTATEDYVLHIYTQPETPLFSMSIAGKEYYAKLSEIISQSDGDFTMQEDFGMIYLRERLNASGLGNAFDATLNTLKITVNAESETVIYEVDENFEPISEGIAKGEEHAFTLIDLTPTGLPEFEGAYGALMMINNTESDQYFPVFVVVDIAA